MRTPIDDMKDLIANAGNENPFEIIAREEKRLKAKLKINKENSYASI